MKAVLFDTFGGPEVLQVREIPEPVPGDGEVLVEIHASTVNPADCHVRRGARQNIVDTKFPIRLGRDISGIAPSTTGQTRETLRAMARDAAANRYDVLGEMSRAEGGGLVYFARELETGKIVGLQIEPGPEATVTMTETQFESLGDTLKIEQPRRPIEATDTGRRLSIPRGIEHQPPPPAVQGLAPADVPRQRRFHATPARCVAVTRSAGRASAGARSAPAARRRTARGRGSA